MHTWLYTHQDYTTTTLFLLDMVVNKRKITEVEAIKGIVYESEKVDGG